MIFNLKKIEQNSGDLENYPGIGAQGNRIKSSEYPVWVGQPLAIRAVASRTPVPLLTPIAVVGLR